MSYSSSPISSLITYDRECVFSSANLIYCRGIVEGERDELPVCTLENGCTVNCLAVFQSSSVEGILVGCKDHLFVHCTGSTVPPRCILSTCGDRILSFFCEVTSNLCVVVSASGKLFWTTSFLECVREDTPDDRWDLEEVRDVGILLSSCCVRKETKSLTRDTIYIGVFAATYSGCVELFNLKLKKEHRGGEIVHCGKVVAHRDGCAVFAVKYLETFTEMHRCSVVATCCDDRSAKAFFSVCADKDPQSGGPWNTLWDGAEHVVSRARVFDVSVEEQRSRDERFKTFLVLSGSEDGYVRVAQVKCDLYTSCVLETAMIYEAFQHGGRGLWKVALRTMEDCVYALSGGFDGTVTATRVSGHMEGDEVTVTRLKALDNGDDNDPGSKSTIRGIYTDTQHRVLCVYETMLGVFEPKGTHYISWSRPLEQCLSLEKTGSSHKAVLPTACGVVGDLPNETPTAVIGCSNGCLITIAYSLEPPRIDIFSSLSQYRKCVGIYVDTSRVFLNDGYEVISSHISNQLVIHEFEKSTGKLSPRYVLSSAPGLQTSCVLCCPSPTMEDEWYCLVGDRKGSVTSYCLPLTDWNNKNNCAAHSVAPMSSVKCFQQDIAAIVSADETAAVTVVSSLGEFGDLPLHHLHCSPTLRQGEFYFQYPTRLAFSTSSIRYYSSSFIVSQLGNQVTFYKRDPRHSWIRVFSLNGVRAPRLLSCAVSGEHVHFSFCNDGKTIESNYFSRKTPLLGHACVLHGSRITGKDTKAVTYWPYLHSTVFGNEDSTVTVTDENGCNPNTFAGPHHSNILVCAVLNEKYLVTAGSLGALTVWSSTWRVLAHHSAEDPTSTSTESVPRLLSFHSLDEQNEFLMGGSDGTVSWYRFSITQENDVEQGCLSLVRKATVAPVHPKPIMCFSECNQRGSFYVAGDSGGRLHLFRRKNEEYEVLGMGSFSNCSVNCLGERLQEVAPSRHRGVCGADSGTLYVFDVVEGEGEDRYSILKTVAYNLGICSIRSLLWKEGSLRFTALNDELVSVFELDKTRLRKMYEKRINVQCMSSACYLSEERRICVGGQGVEILEMEG